MSFLEHQKPALLSCIPQCHLFAITFTVNTGTFALTDCSLTELETSATGGEEGNENAMELVVQEQELPFTIGRADANHHSVV